MMIGSICLTRVRSKLLASRSRNSNWHQQSSRSKSTRKSTIYTESERIQRPSIDTSPRYSTRRRGDSLSTSTAAKYSFATEPWSEIHRRISKTSLMRLSEYTFVKRMTLSKSNHNHKNARSHWHKAQCQASPVLQAKAQTAQENQIR